MNQLMTDVQSNHNKCCAVCLQMKGKTNLQGHELTNSQRISDLKREAADKLPAFLEIHDRNICPGYCRKQMSYLHYGPQWISGFGGLKVACWPLVPKFVGSNPAEAVGLFGRKNPQHAFLRRGNKAVCPMSYFTACKRTQKWRGSRHFRQNFSAISRP
jgi:hypothetical protein